jgi:hypothetical protein
MATASGVGQWVAKGVYHHKWSLTGTVTNGRPAVIPNLPDKTIQVRGTFAGGGTVSVTIFGSNATAGAAGSLATSAAFPLNDSRGDGNAMTFTAVDGRQINENPFCIFPKLTTVSGGTSLTVELVARGGR